MSTSARIRSALKELHYPHQWLESGFLDNEFLERQLARLHRGEDRNLEHFRFAAFQDILDKNASLDDDAIVRYITLAQQDEDPLMAESALIKLLSWSGLSDEQLFLASNMIMNSSANLAKVARRHLLTRELRGKELTPGLIDRVVESNDGVVQKTLLEKSDLPPQTLLALANSGANRAIRNIASNRLGRHL